MTTPEINPALIAGLAVQAERLSAEGKELNEALHARGEELQAVTTALSDALDAFRRYKTLVRVLGVVAIISMGLLLLTAGLNYANGHAIKSCTTPTGSCYQRSQDNGAVLLACANKYPKDIEAIRACVKAAQAKR